MKKQLKWLSFFCAAFVMFGAISCYERPTDPAATPRATNEWESITASFADVQETWLGTGEQNPANFTYEKYVVTATRFAAYFNETSTYLEADIVEFGDGFFIVKNEDTAPAEYFKVFWKEYSHIPVSGKKKIRLAQWYKFGEMPTTLEAARLTAADDGGVFSWGGVLTNG